MGTLIRHCVLQLLIWVCTICLCFTKRTLGFLPNSLLCFPCPHSVGRPDVCSFFLGIFFLRTLDGLVSNCSWRNSQFIGIKFILLPLPPRCWNIRKKVCLHVWISIFVKWSVKLSDLPVFRRGNHWETTISKSIAVSYPGNFMIHAIALKSSRIHPQHFEHFSHKTFNIYPCTHSCNENKLPPVCFSLNSPSHTLAK